MKNPYLCLTIVCMLGACAALCIVGVVVINAAGRETPPSLVAIVGTCVGSLASFLVSVPRGSVGGAPAPEREEKK